MYQMHTQNNFLAQIINDYPLCYIGWAIVCFSKGNIHENINIHLLCNRISYPLCVGNLFQQLKYWSCVTESLSPGGSTFSCKEHFIQWTSPLIGPQHRSLGSQNCWLVSNHILELYTHTMGGHNFHLVIQSLYISTSQAIVSITYL